MELIERSKVFFGEVVAEAKRVSWPSRKELRDGTTVVIVMTIIMACIVAVLDLLLNLGLRRLFR
jgi:preprotein translocase subunit SecE